MFACLCCRAFDLDHCQRQLQHLPTDSIFAMGWRFSSNPETRDSSMACLDVVASRYRPDMPAQQIEKVLQALSTQWYLYSLVYFDQARGFKCLDQARKVCERAGISLGPIILNYGCAYQNLAEQTSDPEMYAKAYDYLVKAYRKCEQEKRPMLHLAFSNLVEVAEHLGRLDSIGPIYDSYLVSGPKYPYTSFAYNKLLYAGARQMSHGQAEAAVRTFDKMLQAVPHIPEAPRYEILALQSRARAFKALGETAKAEQDLLRAQQTCRRWGQNDVLMLNHRMLSELYEQTGQTAKANDYRSRYLAIKDTMLNFRQISSINSTSFLGQMERKDAELQQSAQKRRYLAWALAAAVAVALVVGGLLVALRRNYRRIVQANERLYRQIMDNLDRDSVAAQAPAPRRDGKEHGPGTGDQELMDNIRQAMTREGDVYRPDFCAQRLSELTGVPYNYLSQAINAVTGENFATLVKKYRVDQACRLLADGSRWETLSIEGVGQTVGFTTRQTFTRAFKEITGLTPSDFRAAAKARS